MRISQDVYRDGLLFDGYDYDRQAWVKDGMYLRCGHPQAMQCGCFGREFAGVPVADVVAAGGRKPNSSTLTQIDAATGADIFAEDLRADQRVKAAQLSSRRVIPYFYRGSFHVDLFAGNGEAQS